ncbi:MAG TPA: hypothetical protein VI386_38030 [Candidatus Sulfotelmatobacter sp.]
MSIGGVAVQIAGSCKEEVILDSEHAPFRIETGHSDINIGIKWFKELAVASHRMLFDSGTTWRLYQCEDRFQFDFGDPITHGRPYKRLLIDGEFRRAELQMSFAYFAASSHPADPLGYPLDELLIMHRLTQEKAIELHGCGIVTEDGVGNLFVGHSGAGKSTTTRLWTASQDVEVLSDDRIIVRLDEETPSVQMPRGACGGSAEQQVLRLRDCSASRNSRFAQDDRACGIGKEASSPMRMYGTPWHGEAMFASPASAPLTRIMVLEHGHNNVLTRLSPSQAVAELFARSFVPMHRQEYVESALAFLEQLAESLPSYRYSFEPDQRAVDTILNLHD